MVGGAWSSMASDDRAKDVGERRPGRDLSKMRCSLALKRRVVASSVMSSMATHTRPPSSGNAFIASARLGSWDGASGAPWRRARGRRGRRR